MNEKPESVIVRSPFPERDLPRVWLWLQPVKHSVCDDSSPKTMAEFVDQQLDLLANSISWGVWRNETLGGFIRFDPVSELAGYAHAIFNKGMSRDASFFGRKTTVPALTQVARDLFHIGIEQIIMTPFESNHSLHSLLGYIGAKKVALLYDAATQQGKSINLVQFVLTPDRLRKEEEEAICQSV